MPRKVKAESLAKKVQGYFRAKDLGKKWYGRADALMAEIAIEAKPGELIPLGADGKKAVLIDKFKDRKIVWTPCAARPYDLEVRP